MDGGQQPDDPNAIWRRPTENVSAPSEPSSTDAVTETSTTPDRWISRAVGTVRNWWNDLQFVQMWHVVAIAVILATAGFGGLDTVDKAQITFEPGEPFNNNQFLIVVKKGTVLPEVTGDRHVLAKAKPGRVYLGLSVEVTNEGNIPGSVPAMFSLPGLADVQNPNLEASSSPMSLRIQDGTSLDVLQPGLKVYAGIVWSVPASAVQPGSQVEVRVPFRRYGSGFVIYGSQWRDNGGYATVTVPIEAPK